MTKINTAYIITIIDYREQWNTGKGRYRTSRTLKTTNYDRLRQLQKLLDKGNFDYIVTEIKQDNKGGLAVKVDTFQNQQGYQMEKFYNYELKSA